jgi:signal transduction histidine kinase
MDWAQAQDGRMDFSPEYFEIRAVINEVVLLMNDIAEHKSIVISSEIPNDIKVYSDKAMVVTVLRNLISNAIKFTQIDGKIMVFAEIKQNELIVSISDNGVGISKARMDNLFKITEKHSTPGTQKEKGTGLGLILCKEFIEKNKGKIWIESQVGIGTTFYFTLPLNEESIID